MINQLYTQTSSEVSLSLLNHNSIVGIKFIHLLLFIQLLVLVEIFYIIDLNQIKQNQKA